MKYLFIIFVLFFSCTVKKTPIISSAVNVKKDSVIIVPKQTVDTVKIKAAQKNPALIDTAQRYVGITELTGKNDGYFIEKFLNFVGKKKGDSYCAAFVSYCASKSFVKYPSVRSGVARAFKVPGYIRVMDIYYGAKIMPKGSLVGFENVGTWSGHIELLTEDAKGKIIHTIGANTSNGLKGSQANGNGIWERTRQLVPYGPSSRGLIITWFTNVSY